MSRYVPYYQSGQGSTPQVKSQIGQGKSGQSDRLTVSQNTAPLNNPNYFSGDQLNQKEVNNAANQPVFTTICPGDEHQYSYGNYLVQTSNNKRNQIGRGCVFLRRVCFCV